MTRWPSARPRRVGPASSSNAAVRDVEALANIDLGLLALAGVPRRSRKEGLGAKRIPITFGGATFEPGGTIWCDADGIVTAPPQS